MKEDKELERHLEESAFYKQEVALNTLVAFIRLAHKRGAFELEETAEIINAIKVFATNDNKSDNIQSQEVN